MSAIGPGGAIAGLPRAADLPQGRHTAAGTASGGRVNPARRATRTGLGRGGRGGRGPAGAGLVGPSRPALVWGGEMRRGLGEGEMSH